MEKGFSPETSGTFKTAKARSRMTADGNLIKVASAMPTERLRLDSLDDVLQHIKSRPNYNHADMTKGVNLFMQSINQFAGDTPLIQFSEETQKFQFSDDFQNLSKGDFKNAEAVKRDYLAQGFEELNQKMRAGKVTGLSLIHI